MSGKTWAMWKHTLAEPARCPSCDELTYRMIQRTDGITVLDATCVPCSELGPPARKRTRARKPRAPRKSRGAEGIRSPLLT